MISFLVAGANVAELGSPAAARPTTPSAASPGEILKRLSLFLQVVN
jgi:hypothetical protein